jgi:hypothetical protein
MMLVLQFERRAATKARKFDKLQQSDARIFIQFKSFRHISKGSPCLIPITQQQ